MYTEQTFQIPELKGISMKQIEVHLKLYAGYVKHTNVIIDKIQELKQDSEKNAYTLGELNRRYGFEFDGMRLHEYYFEALEKGSQAPDATSALVQALIAQYGSFDIWMHEFMAVGMTRGIGWTLLTYDTKGKHFHNTWVSDHELGNLSGLPIILAMDMWEHAFMVDYVPAEKGNYIKAFFENLNWEVIQGRFQA